jgi:3-dehydroquinate dehydratase
MDCYRNSVRSYSAIKLLKDTKTNIKSSHDFENTPALESGIQKFNPSTSPPMNSFMDRLSVRNLLYQGK